MPTIGTIRTRIRTQLNEATQRFFPDSASAGLIGWFSDGLAQQHHVVLEMARTQGRLGELTHPYLKRYAKAWSINIVAATQLYALPADIEELVHVGIANAAGVDEKRAAKMDQGDHWHIRHLPHLRPNFDRPAWALQVDHADGAVKLEVLVFGDSTVPNAPLVARLYGFREVARVEDLNPNANVDADDPYCEGPIWYSVAQADIKRGGDGGQYLQMAMMAAQNIIAPLVAAEASGGQAQATAAAMQVRDGEARDAR